MKKTDILDVTARKLTPFIILFGCYLGVYGHLSPGGGFQGGVVLASGYMLFILCRGQGAAHAHFPEHTLTVVEIVALSLFVLIGVVGIVTAGHFLSVIIPPGTGGNIGSAGFMVLLNLIIGLKVGAGISIICYHLFRR